MKLNAHVYTFYWQLKKNLVNTHFSPLFFVLSQLLWPLILIGTYYLSYTPLMDPALPGVEGFSRGESMFAYLIPGVVVVYLYLEYVSIGFSLSVNRDYGVLEPVFLSPVNRMLWLFGTATAALPSGFTAATGFIVSSVFIFGVNLPHPVLFMLLVLFVILGSIPWGALVCAVFLCGRNSRFLYSVFETPAEFMSGSRFPLSALPAVLSGMAFFYPLSHAVNLLRAVWSVDIARDTVFKEMLIIPFLGFLYAAAATLLFSWAERKGKRDGTLTFA